MHDTALEFGARFFDAYCAGKKDLTIIDIGAQDVNGSLRSVAPPECKYIGVDFVEGRGVDVLIDDPYHLPFPDGEADICLSSSCFEHTEFFWLSYLEVLRVLKPDGLFYLNVPSNGHFHRYPVDCWRFYPDSGIALQNWARRNGYDAELLESFLGAQKQDIWNDFVAVFIKDTAHADRFPKRIQDQLESFTNGRARGKEGFVRYSHIPEDQQLFSGNKRRTAARLGRRFVARALGSE